MRDCHRTLLQRQGATYIQKIVRSFLRNHNKTFKMLLFNFCSDCQKECCYIAIILFVSSRISFFKELKKEKYDDISGLLNGKKEMDKKGNVWPYITIFQ